jgi:hypothetical protein
MACFIISWFAAISNIPPKERMETFAPVLPNGRIGTVFGFWSDAVKLFKGVAAVIKPEALIAFRNVLRDQAVFM